MKLNSCMLGLIMPLVILTSCQKGVKIVETIEHEGEECIETYYVKTDIVEGDTVKTPCSKHKIETKNGELLMEWTDKYNGPGDSYRVGPTKFYKTEFSSEGEKIHYLYMESENDEGAWGVTKTYHLVDGKSLLLKYEEYKDDGEEHYNIVKTYHNNGELASERKANTNGDTISAMYYNEDGEKLSLLEAFNKSLEGGGNFVYSTIMGQGYNCFIFYPLSAKEGNVTLVYFDLNMDTYQENSIWYFRYKVKDDEIFIYSGKAECDNSRISSSFTPRTIDDINLTITIANGGDVQLSGFWPHKSGRYDFKKRNVSFDIEHFAY